MLVLLLLVLPLVLPPVLLLVLLALTLCNPSVLRRGHQLHRRHLRLQHQRRLRQRDHVASRGVPDVGGGSEGEGGADGWVLVAVDGAPRHGNAQYRLRLDVRKAPLQAARLRKAVQLAAARAVHA